MEDIIYVIIIIAGILISIIKKLATPKAPKKLPHRPPPKVQPAQRPPIIPQQKQQPRELTPFEQFFKVFEEQARQPAPPGVEPVPPIVEKKTEVPKPKPVPEESLTRKMEPSKPALKTTVPLPRVEPIWLLAGRNQQTLRELVLAAEILGPCKAKRRHPTI